MQMPITTTLPKTLLKQIEIYAKENGKKKNEVFEESLMQFLASKKMKSLEQSFKKAAMDIEIVNMAEEGLTDYNRQLKKLKI